METGQCSPRGGPESEWFNKYSRDDCRHRFIGHLCIGINVSHGKYPNGSGDDELAIQEPELRAINATEDGVSIHVNITNVGDQNIHYDDMWLSIDGSVPFQASQHHNSTSVLFPGEIQYIQISGVDLLLQIEYLSQQWVHLQRLQ
ncbi:MAG: hypothetical protein Ct9H90mP16_11230 [Candidatus Poseidoniales archaeon]|nr:MAG: hypothetical protein Ct9H90mP16_11230 [Candidatus Poseidoniales archaeon]